MHTKGRQRRGSAVCQLSMGKKKGNTFWVTRGVRWKQRQDRIDGPREPRRGRLSQTSSSHSCCFFFVCQNNICKPEQLAPKARKPQSWGTLMSSTRPTWSDCTALTHVQAFMTFWASFYSFHNECMNPEICTNVSWKYPCRGIIPCLLYKLKCSKAGGKQIWAGKFRLS